jgi:hypothetical protein
MAPPYVSVVVPYWAMALLLAPLVGLAPQRQMRRRWRRRRGRCEDCGYDLRASPAPPRPPPDPAARS